jgi:hypothetical protein
MTNIFTFTITITTKLTVVSTTTITIRITITITSCWPPGIVFQKISSGKVGSRRVAALKSGRSPSTARRCCPSPSPLLRPALVASCRRARRRRDRGAFRRLSSQRSSWGSSSWRSSRYRRIRVPVAGPPSHRPTLIVVLVHLRGRRRAATGRPRMRRRRGGRGRGAMG